MFGSRHVPSLRLHRALGSYAWVPSSAVTRPDTPRTTVVVPCYNHEPFVRQTLRSLRQQTCQDFDTILIDDCSEDGTLAALDEAAPSLEGKGRVSVLRNDVNSGQAATLNAGFAAARTDLVTVLNDDDLLDPSALSVVHSVFAQHRRVHLVGLESRHFSGDSPPSTSRASAPGPVRYRMFEPSRVRQMWRSKALNMTHSGMTCSRAAWAAVGGYSGPAERTLSPYSDRDLQFRIACSFPAVIVEQPLVWWRSDRSVDAGRNS